MEKIFYKYNRGIECKAVVKDCKKSVMIRFYEINPKNNEWVFVTQEMCKKEYNMEFEEICLHYVITDLKYVTLEIYNSKVYREIKGF